MGADGRPEAGAKPRPYVRRPFDERGGRFSPEPNPRWVAYSSDESGRPEVYLQAFPDPRGQWQISVGGGTAPEWTPGGQEILYLSPGNKLMTVKLKLGEEKVEASAPRELFSMSEHHPYGAAPVVGAYRIAPDGKRLLIRSRLETSPQPLQVILNWDRR